MLTRIITAIGPAIRELGATGAAANAGEVIARRRQDDRALINALARVERRAPSTHQRSWL